MPIKLLKKPIKRSEIVLTGIALLSLILFTTDGDFFLLDMVQSFSFQAIKWFLFLAILAFVIKRKLLGSVSLFASLFLAFFHWQILFPPQIKPGNYDLKIAHFNVLFKNDRFEPVVEAARSSDADLLSFQEVNKKWAKVLLDSFQKEYPYFKYVAREDGYGIAFFSKYEVDSFQIRYWVHLPVITGSIVTKNGLVSFLAMHTKSPVTEERYRIRNAQLDSAETYLNSIKGPKLAVGDFNIVPWASEMRKVLDTTGMEKSRTGYMATFPNGYDIVQIPIDYILHCDEMTCTNFKVLNNVSSDHYGISGEYRLNNINRITAKR